MGEKLEEEKNNDFCSLIVNRKYNSTIAFGLDENKATFLTYDKWPTKNEIKLIVKLCKQYLLIADEEINLANKQLQCKFKNENKPANNSFPKPKKKTSGHIYFIKENNTWRNLSCPFKYLP